MPTRHTILVVDDEPDVVESVQNLLRLQYRVLGATSAQEGIEILKQQEVHVVMTDQRMPEMTGVELLRHIRGEHPDCIRLMITGYADIRAVVDAINQGNVYRYITKPWDPEELVAIIRQAVEHYELLAGRKRLLAELQVKNQELEKANSRLRQADELKAAFIKVASHELRTPLTILLGLSDLAVQTPGVDNPLKDWLLRSRKAAKRLQDLMDQVMKMLQAGRYERPLERRPVDLAQLLKEAAEEVRPFVELRRQRLVQDLPADLGRIHVESGKIRDSIGHLLLNAIKFTPDEGKIGLAARRTPDGGATITVSDSGIGIDARSLPRVFEPFFTSFDVSRHSSGQFEFCRRGLGLGLSVVDAFVKQHGGKIEVQSAPDQGSTFTITLPDRTPPETV
jgi:signal transduction histidine kinase